MNKEQLIKLRRLFLLISFALTLVIIYALMREPAYRPFVKVSGDVKNVLYFNGHSYKDLGSMIAHAEPVDGEHHLLLVGSDGLTARIHGRLDRTFLEFSDQNGWEIKDGLRPVSVNIKHLKEIVVVSDNRYSELSVNLFDDDENNDSFTPGQFYERNLERSLVFEGRSEIERGPDKYSVEIFTTKFMMSLNDHSFLKSRELLAIGRGGEELVLKNGSLVFADNRIDCYDEGRRVINDVAGIMADPPELNISQAYYDALDLVGKGEKVMLIFLDGFSYAQYDYSGKNGLTPFMSDLPDARKAITYFKPVTNVGFAAMITGKGPDQNGIHDRSFRELDSSIFTVLKEQGRRSVLLEADISILDHGADERLHVDKNGDGSIDDETFATAMEEIKNDYDYILVHFHKIDDMGHSYGPFGEKTLEQIRLSDGYVRELVKGFFGKVIITADHGMHSEGDAGSHGQARYEDFVVPYLIVNGGSVR